MKREGVIWFRDIVDKLIFKHNVETHEVEEVLGNKPKFRFVEKGEREDEDVYLALGQTDGGRYLAVLFIYKETKETLILSARDMARKEKRHYGKNRSKKIPTLRSPDKLVKLFDTHDMGEYWDQMPEAHFDVNIRKRIHLFSLDTELESKLAKIARAKHVSSEKLINAWLKEKLQEQMEKLTDGQRAAYKTA